uniref:response regulator transcription factor n=1 Tax=uncultured Caulobacter sp. TaxID=158749 RepID=UPI0025DAEBE6|nr:response regulator transcription factor [uncultured Caulobacter sp.]
MRVLLVEDTVDLGEAIVICLERMGHAVDWARDGQSADELLQDIPYELTVLDLTLPELDGAVVLKRLRARGDGASVLVITARDAVEDRVGVLDLGADDYLVKPFDFRELEARVRSLLRRRGGGKGTELVCAGLRFDRTGRMVSVNGEPIWLTRREISLLEVLLASQSRVTSKIALLEQMFDHTAEPNENAIEVIIARLRPKLAGSGATIRTYRGVGYRIEPDGGVGAGLRAAG